MTSALRVKKPRTSRSPLLAVAALAGGSCAPTGVRGVGTGVREGGGASNMFKKSVLDSSRTSGVVGSGSGSEGAAASRGMLVSDVATGGAGGLDQQWQEGGKFNQGFISDSRGRGSCSTQSSQFITDFIVSLNHTAPFLALNSMLFGKRGTTTITGGGEA